MDYVRSNKGGMKLLFQNNLYVKQKVLSSGATMHYFIDPCLMYFTAKNQIEISFP